MYEDTTILPEGIIQHNAPGQRTHRAALKIAERGKPVFPCKPDKSPYTKHGFLDATVDHRKVNMFWNRFRAASIGVPTGDVSGLLVLDVDVDSSKGKDGEGDLLRLEARHGKLPRT